MKILMVNTGIFPVPPKKGGAIETHTYYLSKVLTELGNEVHYVTDVTDKAEFNRDVVIHKVYAPPLKFQTGFHGWTCNYAVGNILAFRSTLLTLIREQFDFDIMHVHGNLSGLFTCMVKRSIPLIYTMHNPSPWMYVYRSSYEQAFRELAYRFVDVGLIRKADHVIAVSKVLKNELNSRWAIPKEKVTVIPNGVDINVFRPDIPNVHSVKARYGIKGRYCLFVGQLRHRKGVDYLLQALNGMSDVDINCVIVGDGPARGALVKLASNLKLSERVVFTGAVPFEDLPPLYAGADFFVLPTMAEGLPLVILEAMASGLPVISTNVSGVLEIIRGKYNGFIVSTRDVLALREFIRLLAEDHNLRKEMANNARQTAIEKFSWLSVVKKIVAVYKQKMRKLFHA